MIQYLVTPSAVITHTEINGDVENTRSEVNQISLWSQILVRGGAECLCACSHAYTLPAKLSDLTAHSIEVVSLQVGENYSFQTKHTNIL